MKTLSVRQASGQVQEVILRGDRRDPEPLHFRVRFPGGEFEITRTTDDDYWIHVYVNTEGREGWNAAAVLGQMTEIRFDEMAEAAPEARDEIKDAVNLLPLADVYHMAVRVAKRARR